jgi:hypothetical protein
MLRIQKSDQNLLGIIFNFYLGHSIICVHTRMIIAESLTTDFLYAHSCIRTLGCLGQTDLRRVQDTIWEARTQWYNLGLGLDIAPDTLDAIELAKVGNPDRCFTAMLTKWLRENPRPTWSALAEALKSRSVGLSQLAEEVLPKQN